uniref:Wd-40 repeat-containing protein n=1 Tax=Tetraselmis sp. GSL018 TaxID=582737 RepID=A0A061RC44_9CHLO
MALANATEAQERAEAAERKSEEISRLRRKAELEASEAEERMKSAQDREASGAALLLSNSKGNLSSRGIRAVLKAAHIAVGIGQPLMVSAALQEAVERTLSQPYVEWTLQGHGGQVNSVSFSPDGKQAVSGGDDGTVRVWPIGKPQGRFQVPKLETPKVFGCTEDAVLGVAWSKGGELIAACTSGGSVCVWRNARWFVTNFYEKSGWWNQSRPSMISQEAAEHCAVGFSNRGNYLATSSGSEGQVRIWAVGSGEETSAPKELHENLCSAGSFAWSPSGNDIAAGCSDGKIRVYSLTSSAPAILSATLEGLPDGSAGISLAFSADGEHIAAATREGNVGVWVTSSDNSMLCSFSVQKYGGARSIAWSPAHGSLAIASRDMRLLLYEESDIISKDSCGESLKPSRQLSGEGTLPVLSVSWSGDGATVAAGSATGDVGLWRQIEALGEDGPFVGDLACPQVGDTIGVVAWTADRLRIASGSSDRTVCIWDSLHGDSGTGVWRPASQVLAQESSVIALAWAPGGSAISAAGDSGEIAIWGEDDGGWKRQSLKEASSGARAESLSFSSDGELLAAGLNSGDIMVWHVRSGAHLELKKHSGRVLVWVCSYPRQRWPRRNCASLEAIP